MRFSDIIGNDELKATLVRMIDTDRLGHAILLSEEGGWGALAFAVALSQYLNCKEPHDSDSCGKCSSCHKFNKLIHPDLHFAFPINATAELSDSEKKAPVSDYFLKQWRELFIANPYFSEMDLYEAIGIDKKSGIIGVNEAKRIFEKLTLKSFEADYKTMIIWLPEKMNQEASNKLLKLLEEPPAGTLFILVSHAPEKILTTIRSRCQHIRLKPLSREERTSVCGDSGIKAEYMELIVNLLHTGIEKRVVDTFAIWESISELGREGQKEFCLAMEIFIRKIFMVANSLEQIADATQEEMEAVKELAPLIKPSFYEKGFKYLEDAMKAVESNVNPKLIFCDLCNRILLSL